MNKSPRSIAFYLALSAALFSAIFSFLTTYIIPESYWWEILSVFLITFFLMFLLIYFVFKKYIYQKIMVLYRTIYNLKITREKSPELEMNSDVFQKVDDDVKEWANEKIDEIRSLKEIENFRRDFIGNLAHELKTPLFNIQGYVLSLFEGALEDPNVSRKFLKKASNNIDRMTRIIDDLDTITQIESDMLELDIQTIDIVNCVKEVIEELDALAAKKSIAIRFNRRYDTPVMVRADEFRISQVVSNLIINSISYGRKNGETEVRFHDMEERILVEVSDNGRGIEKMHLPRLFERFYRVDRSRSRVDGGTGLGLAIVKHIIEAHKQTINVRSTPGVGSTFSFTLAKA